MDMNSNMNPKISRRRVMTVAGAATVGTIGTIASTKAFADTATDSPTPMDTNPPALPSGTPTPVPTPTAPASTTTPTPTASATPTTAPAFDLPRSPSDIDRRALIRPRPVSTVDLSRMGQRRNLVRSSENLSNGDYAGWAITIQKENWLTGEGVNLTRVSTVNQYSSLVSNFYDRRIKMFTPGNYYMCSYYAAVNSPGERFLWPRALPTYAWGHTHRFVEPDQVVRIWTMKKAVTEYHLADVDVPVKGWPTVGNNPGYHPTWFQMGPSLEGGGATPVDWWFGGMQIEDRGSNDPRNFIAWIGDSTQAGATGAYDSGGAREIPSYTAGLLNTTVFNRAIGGNSTADMDNRWDRDITPIAPLCKYVVIQGGINDLAARSLSDIQGSFNSMVSKARRDGLIPIILTCTPTAPIKNGGGDPKRQDLNTWLKGNFSPYVIDIASIIADPYDSALIRRTEGTDPTGWYGDGIHYKRLAKRAVAEQIANWPHWDLPTPTPYQKVDGNNLVNPDVLAISSPNGTRYALTVGNDGSLSTRKI